MRKATAYKRELAEPVGWNLRPNNRGVIHKIEIVDEVKTADGVMARVSIRNVCDLNDPSTDVAVLVGTIKEVSTLGNDRPQSPELWFWRDKFWTKAIDSPKGVEYYHRKMYIIYEIKVADVDQLFSQIEIC